MRAFVCHATEDKPIVTSLCDELADHRILPWLDARFLWAGDNWRQQILNHIRIADVFIVCVSHSFSYKLHEGYSFIATEVETARDEATNRTDTYIVPVLIESCDLPKCLSQYQSVNATRRRWGNLLQSLKALSPTAREWVAAPSQSTNSPFPRLTREGHEWDSWEQLNTASTIAQIAAVEVAGLRQSVEESADRSHLLTWVQQVQQRVESIQKVLDFPISELESIS